MFMNCGRKPENPVETYEHAERPCKLNTWADLGVGIEPSTLKGQNEVALLYYIVQHKNKEQVNLPVDSQPLSCAQEQC